MVPCTSAASSAARNPSTPRAVERQANPVLGHHGVDGRGVEQLGQASRGGGRQLLARVHRDQRPQVLAGLDDAAVLGVIGLHLVAVGAKPVHRRGDVGELVVAAGELRRVDEILHQRQCGGCRLSGCWGVVHDGKVLVLRHPCYGLTGDADRVYSITSDKVSSVTQEVSK